MRAVVTHDFDESAVEDVPRPDPGPDEALVAVDRVQLSVTECALYRGEEINHHEDVKARLAEGPARLFGHEFCGVVEAVGDSVEGLDAGDRVYAPGKIPCEKCGYCRAGYHNYCNDKEGLGYDRPGALAEYVAVPARSLRRLPEDVSDAEGAALQPLASAVLCVHDADIETGDVVAVVGTGAMGYAAGQLALLQGAGRVYAVDIVEDKLDLAADRGMIPVNAREEDPVERVRSGTGGIGADVAVETVGGDQGHLTAGDDPMAQAVRMARDGGTLLGIGHIFGDAAVTPRTMRSKALTWVSPTVGAVSTGPNADTGDLAADLVAAGRVDIASFVTHELDGLAAFEEAVELTLSDDRGRGPAQMIV